MFSERVCAKHFVSAKPAPYWHKHDVDWVPTCTSKLGKKNYLPELDYEPKAAKRKQLALEQQERVAAEKHRKLHDSSLPFAQFDFTQPSSTQP